MQSCRLAYLVAHLATVRVRLRPFSPRVVWRVASLSVVPCFMRSTVRVGLALGGVAASFVAWFSLVWSLLCLRGCVCLCSCFAACVRRVLVLVPCCWRWSLGIKKNFGRIIFFIDINDDSKKRMLLLSSYIICLITPSQMSSPILSCILVTY